MTLQPTPAMLKKAREAAPCDCAYRNGKANIHYEDCNSRLQPAIAAALSDCAAEERERTKQQICAMIDGLTLPDNYAASDRHTDACCRAGIKNAIEARDALLRCHSPEGWRPITIAPKDGNKFLLAHVNSTGLCEVSECRFVGGMFRCDQVWEQSTSPDILGWMPLPAPPAAGG